MLAVAWVPDVDATPTDEASAMEASGHHPALVRGSVFNFKITWPEDLALAEAWLAGRGRIAT